MKANSKDSIMPASFKAVRFQENPIIRPGMPGLEGEDGANINGPSLIRVPDWVEKPLGKYYLYFAHHGGKHIRLAYADAMAGPWTIYKGGVLKVTDTKSHVASPDVHVDMEKKEIRMYFHRSEGKGLQETFVALSRNGLDFTERPEVLGSFYFRVFKYGDWYYAFAKNVNIDGTIYRSKDGLSGFEKGPSYLPGVRHTALWVEADTLNLVYTIVGEKDTPERIYMSQINLKQDWLKWKPSAPQLLLEPTEKYEGTDKPVKPSKYGKIIGSVRQLRDPAIFEEDGSRYLLYSVAGESGIGIAELK